MGMEEKGSLHVDSPIVAAAFPCMMALALLCPICVLKELSVTGAEREGGFSVSPRFRHHSRYAYPPGAITYVRSYGKTRQRPTMSVVSIV